MHVPYLYKGNYQLETLVAHSACLQFHLLYEYELIATRANLQSCSVAGIICCNEYASLNCDAVEKRLILWYLEFCTRKAQSQ